MEKTGGALQLEQPEGDREVDYLTTNYCQAAFEQGIQPLNRPNAAIGTGVWTHTAFLPSGRLRRAGRRQRDKRKQVRGSAALQILHIVEEYKSSAPCQFVGYDPVKFVLKPDGVFNVETRARGLISQGSGWEWFGASARVSFKRSQLLARALR
ncbi:hypothetical protein INR49_026443 [Caranx melampygus]|nr:hypothetical protein INR49_026443 [Caranx melampygus]